MSNLAILTSKAAVDIDNYLIGRGENFSATTEFANALKERINEGANPSFYLAMQGALDPQEEIRDLSELVYEMKILSYDLANLKHLPKSRLKDLRELCVEASRQFAAMEELYFRRVA